MSIKDFKAFGQPLLNLIAASPYLVTEDEVTFDLVGDSNHAKATKKELPIKENIYTIFVAQGGGNVKAKGRSATDAKRASLPKGIGATGVQRSTYISTTPINGTTSPTDPLNTLSYTSGASFLHELSPDNVGLYLNSWERWYDTNNPKRGGPWSRRQVIPIT
jgi:hypothetical protein